MSEHSHSHEPIHPHTHLEIVASSKRLVDTLVEADRAKGFEPTTSLQYVAAEDDTEPDTRPVYELHPAFKAGWKGRFFSTPTEGDISVITVHAPSTSEDRDRNVYIKALFDAPTQVEPVSGFRAYMTSHKGVVIPTTEAVPSTSEVSEIKLYDEAMVIEAEMSESEGQDLLSDLQDLLDMQS